MKLRDYFRLGGALFLAGASTLHAGVIVGLPEAMNIGNCIPFGCAGGHFLGETISTFQEIYASTAFPGEMSITGIDFFDTQVLPASLPDSGAYTLSLSYSLESVGALDLISPANNISFGSQTFFTGPLPSVSNGE